MFISINQYYYSQYVRCIELIKTFHSRYRQFCFVKLTVTFFDYSYTNFNFVIKTNQLILDFLENVYVFIFIQ